MTRYLLIALVAVCLLGTAADAQTLYVMGGGVAVAMLILLSMSFGSTKAAVLVMINLPLALIGGIVAIFITESDNLLGNVFALFGIGARYESPVISIASMVGFITLFGIAVRNGILLVNHYAHLTSDEGKPLTEAIMQGSQERLVPILMTALATMVGILPIALGRGAGGDSRAPLGIAVVGGMFFSTALTFFIVPATYLMIERTRSRFSRRTNGVYTPAPAPVAGGE